MEGVLQKFQYLRIQLEEITSATNNFDYQKRIGRGGCGAVYKGEVSHFEGRSVVAIKCLDRKGGQGEVQFLKEIDTLLGYKNENLIRLLGFCYQGVYAILVYELASRRSLDRHLNSRHLTWSQRIKICLGAAKGLSYLHDPRGTHLRVIHCDVKSGNILLDDHWNAKVADFGLSIKGPANELQSTVINLAVGTPAYTDPLFQMTNTLTKESDVYSFGVVLLEVLFGRLCYTHSNGRLKESLVPSWVESLKQKNLNEVIFKNPNPTIQPLNQSALEIFSDIAYRCCLKESREDRPQMAEVVTELETAVRRQEFSEGISLSDYEEIIKTAEPPLNYSSNDELWELLSKGVLLNGDKTLFSLNKKGEHCVMISFEECVNSGPSKIDSNPSSSHQSSRFAVGPYISNNMKLKTRVKTQFLSPGITYTVNLVFKIIFTGLGSGYDPMSLEYSLQGETKTSFSHVAYEREDGWRTAELYQFTSDQRIVDLEILFSGFNQDYDLIEVEGIEFRPWEKEDEEQPISDSDVNWEEKLPTDYEDIMKRSKNSLQWTTKKEAYSHICKGFLINDGQEWFSVDKNGKKCLMISATVTRLKLGLHRMSSPQSRFGEVIQWVLSTESIENKIQPQLLSSQTTYASYLIYKLTKERSVEETLVEVYDLDSGGSWHIYLACPQTPVIRPKANQNTHNPLNKQKIRGLPRQRNDGWMEVQVWEFQTATPTETISMRLQFSALGKKGLKKIIIEGVEFRPM